MADYQIKRYEDYKRQVTLTIDTVGIDHALYNIKCKMRDAPKAIRKTEGSYLNDQPYFAFTVDKVVGEPSKVDISLTTTQTALLKATHDAPASELPRLDFELELISDSSKVYTDPQTVAIAETYAHD